jgi:hypothetical protein
VPVHSSLHFFANFVRNALRACLLLLVFLFLLPHHLHHVLIAGQFKLGLQIDGQLMHRWNLLVIFGH